MRLPSDSLSTDTYKRLRDLIVRGRLAPGSRLIETDIAARLDVSRTPVRYALHRLEQEGLIVFSDGSKRASSVAPLTKEDGRELLYVVGQIEALAGRWCSFLDEEPRRSVAAELAALNTRLEAALGEQKRDRHRLFELDDRFHQTFVTTGSGPRLLALHRSVKPQAERYLRFYVGAFTHDARAGLSEHAAIVRSIDEGDPEAAERAVEANWRNAANRLGEVIEEMGEVGSW